MLIMFSGVRASEARFAKSKLCPSYSPQNALYPGRNLLLMVQNLFRAASTASQAVQYTHPRISRGNQGLTERTPDFSTNIRKYTCHVYMSWFVKAVCRLVDSRLSHRKIDVNTLSCENYNRIGKYRPRKK